MEALFLPKMVLLRRCQVSRRQFSSTTSHALVDSSAECNGSQKQTTLNGLEIELEGSNSSLHIKLEKLSCNNDSINLNALFRFEDPKLMFIHIWEKLTWGNRCDKVCRSSCEPVKKPNKPPNKKKSSWFLKRSRYHSGYRKYIYIHTHTLCTVKT